MELHDALILYARESMGLSPKTEVQLIPFAGRGSDRAYFRLQWSPDNRAILVHYQPTRIENTYFADIAAFLLENGIPISKILARNDHASILIMQDLGDTDLWTLRNAPWEIRRDLYQRTMKIAHKLHQYPEQRFPAHRVKLMEAFGSDLYRWERNYFTENFVGRVCGIVLKPQHEQQLETELAGLAEKLEGHGRCLVHRDLQSQNVMVYQEEPFLIDFQGMRWGSRFYDLGSLLCDPYVSFAASERLELLSFYYELAETGTDWNRFQNAFWEASAQRLMQALGCYGFLGLTKGLKHYLAHIPNGFKYLQMAAENAGSLPMLLEICRLCEESLNHSNFLISDQGKE
jgi:aminoglycoside/choline kinase family phosphotransferase